MSLTLPYPTQDTGFVIAETVATTNGSPDSIQPGVTMIGGLPVAVILEERSTHGVHLFPRLTSAQLAAIESSTTTAITGGMMAYNSDTGSFVQITGTNTTFNSAPQSASISLTSAELLALNATPQILISPPGSGNIIVVDRVSLSYGYGTVAYTVPGGSNFTFTIGGVTVATAAAAAGLVDQVVDKFLVTPGSTVASTNSTTLENTGLSFTNSAGALTLGDGTLQVTVWYTVISA